MSEFEFWVALIPYFCGFIFGAITTSIVWFIRTKRTMEINKAFSRWFEEESGFNAKDINSVTSKKPNKPVYSFSSGTLGLNLPPSALAVYQATHNLDAALKIATGTIGYFTCPQCGLTSYNANDIQYGYCGKCKDVTSKPTPENKS